MSFPRYPKYKPSGVEWLGEVPEHWNVAPLKRAVAGIESGTSVNATDEPAELGWPAVLKTSCVYTGQFEPREHKRVIPDEVADVSCPVRRGCLIVSRMNTSELVGRAGWVKQQPRDLYLPDRLWQVDMPSPDVGFVHYWTLTDGYRGQVEAACTGTSASMKNLSQDQFLGFTLPCPPPVEAQLIAAFLDRETAKIDALIAEQEKLIELLAEKRQAVISHAVTKGLNPAAPKKPSGVEWLGDVPAHWEIVRLAGLFRDVAEEGNDGLQILSVSIHDGVSDKEMSESELDRKVTRSEDRSKYVKVQPGDLVYNMMRAWQGAFGTVQTLGMVSPAYVVARPKSDAPTEFFERVLRTPNAVEQMRRYSQGVTDFRLRLYWDEFKNLRVPLPPAKEIDALLDHVGQVERIASNIAAEALQLIDLLRERRSALISAAVTGQIDVRNAVPETAA